MLTHILCLPPHSSVTGVRWVTLLCVSSSYSFKHVHHQRNYFTICLPAPWNIWLLCWRVSRLHFFSASGYLPRTTLPFPRTQNRCCTTWLLSKCLNVFFILISWFLHSGCNLLPDTADRALLPKNDGRVLSDFSLCLFWKGSQFAISTFTNFTLLKAFALIVKKKKTAPTSWLASSCAAKHYIRLLVHKWCIQHLLWF